MTKSACTAAARKPPRITIPSSARGLDAGTAVLEVMERLLADGTWIHTDLIPRDDEALGVTLYYALPCRLKDEALGRLLQAELNGISLEMFRRLTKWRLIGTECHRLVAAMVISKCGLTDMEAQTLLGNHLYIIGEQGSHIAKVGRSGDVRRRLNDLMKTSPVRLEVQHVEPGMGRCEQLVHRVLADRRLHGEWFDFGSDDPRRVVRQALLSLDEVAWLRGMAAAVEEAGDENGRAQQARARALAMFERALAVETAIARHCAEADARQKEILAGVDHAALHKKAQAAVWGAVPRPARPR